MKFLLALAVMLLSFSSIADCVWSATASYSYKVINGSTLVLILGDDGNILIKSDSIFFTSGQQISVLKDAFCDYEQSVLRVDGQVVDVAEVRWLRKK